MLVLMILVYTYDVAHGTTFKLRIIKLTALAVILAESQNKFIFRIQDTSLYDGLSITLIPDKDLFDVVSILTQDAEYCAFVTGHYLDVIKDYILSETEHLIYAVTLPLVIIFHRQRI